MIHEPSVRFNNIGHSIIGNVYSNGVVHVVRLSNYVQIVVGAIHAHVLQGLLDNEISVVKSAENLVDLLRVAVGKHLRLLGNACLDDSTLLVKHSDQYYISHKKDAISKSNNKFLCSYHIPLIIQYLLICFFWSKDKNQAVCWGWQGMVINLHENLPIWR